MAGRRRRLVPLAALALALASASVTTAPAAVAKCQRVVVGGKSRCIAAGQTCNPKYGRQYARYALTCSRSARKGPYRLAHRRLTF